MAKRFEEVSSPSYVDLLTAYQLLGIDNLLGAPGKNTAFAYGGGCPEEIVFHVVPGQWTNEDMADLLDIAFSGIAPVQAIPQTV